MPVNGSDTCWPVKTPILYKLKSYGKIRDGGELGIMSEVHKNGYTSLMHVSGMSGLLNTFNA